MARETPLWKSRQVFGLLLIALLAEIGYAVLNISAMPIYLREDRKFNEGVIGLIVVCFLLSEASLKAPMGQLADRYGRRRLIIIGPGITFFTALLTMVVPHNWGYAETIGLMILRILDGVGAAMLWPAAFALMGDLVEDKDRQESMSLLNTCYLLGVALALPVSGAAIDIVGPYLVDFTGKRSASLFLAAALFAAVAVTALRTLPSGKEHREAQAAAKAEAEAQGHSEDIKGLLTALKTIPQYLLMAFVTFCGIGFPMVIIQFFAKDELSMSASEFGLLALPCALGMAALSVPMSRYGKKIGDIKAVHLGLALCAFGLAFISLGAFFDIFRTRLALAVGAIPVGLGFLIAIPAWYASVSMIDPQRRAANIGAVMMAQGFGAMVGALIGAKSYEVFQRISPSFGHYSPFLGCAACVAVAWALSVRILKAS